MKIEEIKQLADKDLREKLEQTEAALNNMKLNHQVTPLEDVYKRQRVILPDPVFGDQKVSKFVNHLMYDGKKNTSYAVSYTHLCFDIYAAQ